MIVISRLENEGVVIGDCVTITVLEIQGEDVWLQIDPRDDVKVELGEDILHEQLSSGAPGESELCESKFDVFS